MTDDKYLTRQTLLMRAKARSDQAAWEEFIEVYQAFIFHVIKRMNIRLDDQEDLVQEVLVLLWEKLESYNPEKGRFRSWLSFVIRNVVLNFIKKNNSQLKKIDRLAKDPSHDFSKEKTKDSEIDKLIEDEWKLHVSTLAFENIRSLFSGKAIEVFEMSLKGLSLNQISDELELPYNSVKVLKSRVKSRYMAEVKRLIHNFEEC